MSSAERREGGVAARLAALLREEARTARVADVRIGLGYTAVALEDGRAGLAYTFRDGTSGCCAAFAGPEPLAGRPADELLAHLGSADPVASALGLACANALADVNDDGPFPGDVLERVDIRPGDDVAMVGHFGPLVAPLLERVRSLRVFERIERPSGILRPAREALEVLPACQVALITATAIVGNTVDALLAAAAGCREVVVLGPSTPLVPGAFAGARVTALAGVVVEDVRQVLRVVSEGGGTRQFGPYVRKVSVGIDTNRPGDGQEPRPSKKENG
jgi:uncharacterized protein (DUF4213/DUF364 family)